MAPALALLILKENVSNTNFGQFFLSAFWNQNPKSSNESNMCLLFSISSSGSVYGSGSVIIVMSLLAKIRKKYPSELRISLLMMFANGSSKSLCRDTLSLWCQSGSEIVSFFQHSLYLRRCRVIRMGHVSIWNICRKNFIHAPHKKGLQLRIPACLQIA